ncbi:HPP family protein [Chloroflexota bacterium]
MAKERTAKDIMKTPVITVKEDNTVANAVKLMAHWKISGLPVVDDEGRLIGMVTGRLIMNTAVSGNAARTSVTEVMSKQLEIYGPVYSPSTQVEELVIHFASSRINRVLIVEDGRVVGIVSRIDIICEMDRIYSQFVMS